uniref:Uncharacterized protein n=1 Tax=Acrobeloides nanus TaxID=290746 RepID=A0A914CER3_9BILA
MGIKNHQRAQPFERRQNKHSSRFTSKSDLAENKGRLGGKSSFFFFTSSSPHAREIGASEKKKMKNDKKELDL